jgi:hypothetical protein
MTQVEKVPDGLFASGPPVRVERLLGLARRDQGGDVRRAFTTLMISWMPVFILVALGSILPWGGDLRSFGTDIAFHARSLVATPLLVVAEGFCAVRLRGIAQHFLDAGLVAEAEHARFAAAVRSTQRLRDLLLAEFVVGLLAYGTTLALIGASPEPPEWRQPGTGPLPFLSPAGWWQAIVSVPILLALIFGWIWRVILWTRFLWLVAGMKLRLVAAHPDLTAGLKFVGYSVRAFAPVALGFGMIVAGAVANGVVTRGKSLIGYRATVLGLVLFVVILFGSPLLVFTTKLAETWRRGVFQYGAIANALGRQFERRWFDTRRVEESALEVQDFSATVDLYQFVAYVYEMRLVPWDLTSLILLVIAALAPFVPVVLIAIPFEVILTKLVSLWF